MKKTYMTPDIQVVKVEQHLLTGSEKTMDVNSNRLVDNADAVLGRGGSSWDDED